MKEVYDKRLKMWMINPTTPLEAVEHLEEFLCADFGAGDWSVKFLHNHFKICKNQIKKMKVKK